MRFCYQGPSLVALAPAKLNLSLEILGRRPDGYHELETVMVSISLYDTLLFTEDDSHQTRLRCHRTRPHGASQSVLASGADNLVVRAADLLREFTGCGQGVTIDLWKRIPIQAGLGGGSSDAAATLVGLNRLWKLGLASDQLHELASQLGSDVNFFLDSSLAAIGMGRGEQISPLAVSRRWHFVVACPKSGLSTGDVFHELNCQRDLSAMPPEARHSGIPQQHMSPAQQLIKTLKRGGHVSLHNDLESSARRLNPDIARTLAALRVAGAVSAQMSGSGSACFAVCHTARHARTIAGWIRQQNLEQTFAVEMRA